MFASSRQQTDQYSFLAHPRNGLIFMEGEIMAGRRPKPTVLKLVQGNAGKRKISKSEPKPKREIPSCPAHMSDAGKVAWGRLSVLLDRMGVLTEADSAALERLCDCYSDILICRESLVADGWTYKTRDAQGNTLIKGNPAANQLRSADSQFKSYLIEFGLTPAARSKVHGSPEEETKDDPLKEFFG